MDDHSGQTNFDAEKISGSLVTARGTGGGLVLRLDGRSKTSALLDELEIFVESRKTFLKGNEVRLEWFGEAPKSSMESRIREELNDRYRIKVVASDIRKVDMGKQSSEGDLHELRSFTDSVNVEDSSLSLFSGIAALDEADDEEEDLVPSMDTRPSVTEEALLWDEPDARIIYKTLRSGQRVETEHSLIVFGDVNSGAELIAGGDIVVLGSLRGVAHAGAYDETGGGRVIVALGLEPTQLRIGSVISRGESESAHTPEIARVDGDIIVVEPYQSRGIFSRNKR